MAKQKRKPASKETLDSGLFEKKAPKKILPLPKPKGLFLFLVLAATLIVYFPSLKNDFTNWDDKEYVTENKHIQKLDAKELKYEFTHEHMGNYHPFSMISLSMDYAMGQLNPQTYHVTNLIFHLLASLMVFLFVFALVNNNLTALITSLLFALHPMHVESVAWVSERKDVLYGFFLVAALWAYVKYLAQKSGKMKWYFIFTALFIFSLLSKAQAVVFPLLCLLIDYLKERKITRNVILEKAPLLGISLIFGILAIHAQQKFEAIQGSDLYPYFDRILFSGYGLLTYLWKLVLPLDLSAFYPYPLKANGMYPAAFYAAPVITLALIVLTWMFLRNNRLIVFGTLFFLLSISLVLQILPVGGAVIADRYTYIPYIGLFFIIAVFFTRAVENKNGQTWIKYAVPVFIFGYCILTWQRIGTWNNSVTLWTDAESKSQISPKIYNNLGNALCDVHQYDSALTYLDIAVKLNNNYDQSHYNRGLVYYYKKDYAKAIADYSESIRCNPNLKQAYYNRGGTYYETGHYKEALADILKAQELGYEVDPRFIQAIKKDGGL